MPENSPRIRTAGPADKPAIMRIVRDTREFTTEDVTIAEEVLDCYFGDSSQSGYYVLVAGLDSAIVSYICFGPTPLTKFTWDIYWLATAPQFKGRGLGTALMAQAEAQIKAAGGKLIIIETSSLPSYAPTRKFYLGRGYTVISIIPDFYDTGDDLVTFTKRV